MIAEILRNKAGDSLLRADYHVIAQVWYGRRRSSLDQVSQALQEEQHEVKPVTHAVACSASTDLLIVHAFSF